MSHNNWTPADIGCKLMPCDLSRPLMELWLFDHQPSNEERELCIAYAATTQLVVYGLVTSDPAPNLAQIRHADLMFFPERFGMGVPGIASRASYRAASESDPYAPDYPELSGAVPTPKA